MANRRRHNKTYSGGSHSWRRRRVMLLAAQSTLAEAGYLFTEAGDNLTDESGNLLVTEAS